MQPPRIAGQLPAVVQQNRSLVENRPRVVKACGSAKGVANGSAGCLLHRARILEHGCEDDAQEYSIMIDDWLHAAEPVVSGM